MPTLTTELRRTLAETVKAARAAAQAALGDSRLVEEVAHSAWHRLLCTRFLAENGLLPADGVEPGQPEMPALTPSLQDQLAELAAGLPRQVFLAADAPGWGYQFWQAPRKQAAARSRSGRKVGAALLGAATQLFTEPYMIDFLLQNTLGAWWADRHGAQSLPEPMPYLRLLPDGTPAAGRLEGWPDRAADLQVLDPCCGTGHVLVGMFRLLVRFRMAEEGLDARTACDAVLRENLHGLDLDPRCVDLARFTLSLAAWIFPGAGGWRPLPPLPMACTGAPVEESLAGVSREEPVGGSLAELFRDAPALGSLIDPTGLPLPADAPPAVRYLAGRYHLVCTNVPYLKGGNQGETLKAYLDRHYPRSKYDLAAAFSERCLSLCTPGGAAAVVTQQYWLFLSYYEGLRRQMLEHASIRLIAPLGSGAFASIPGEMVNVCLQIIEQRPPQAVAPIMAVRADQARGVAAKAQALQGGPLLALSRQAQLEHPDARILMAAPDTAGGEPLSAIADFGKGSVTGDGPHYLRKFWEVPAGTPGYAYWYNSPTAGQPWSGREHVALWRVEGHDLRQEPGYAIRGQRVWGARGIAVGKAGRIRPAWYMGELFDDNLAVIRPHDPADLMALWAFCNDDSFAETVRRLDGKLCVTAGTFTKVPYDRERWRAAAAGQTPPAPYSDDPTQWLFHGHPAPSSAPLQVALARLAGYRWPAELDPEMALAPEARAWMGRLDALQPLTVPGGILCLPPVAGELGLAERLERMLAAAGCPARGMELEPWLRNHFFVQHCALFHQRPFLWHVWDGRPDGFAAVFNYHQLDRAGLVRLTEQYLGAWIQQQETAVGQGEGGAALRAGAARNLQRRLRLILAGQQPYDIFVRWKGVAGQPEGWEPDLHDGVRLNIRPFVQAGVLRRNPRVDWKQDRGTDHPGAPWFDVFGGRRINDRHRTRTEKRMED